MSKLKSLSKIQTHVQSVIRKEKNTEELIPLLIEKAPISTNSRIKIYQDAYQIRMIESLRDDFPNVEDKLGESAFDQLANNFIKQNPSQVKNLAEYSESFPDFIKIEAPEVFIEAVSDWLINLSNFIVNPLEQLSPSEIQSGAPFCLKSHPSIITKKFNKEFLAFYLHDDEVKISKLDSEFFELIQFLKTEKTLDQISQFALNNNISDEQITNIISEWIQNNLIYCKPYKIEGEVK